MTCRLCSSPIDHRATACPRCGLAVTPMDPAVSSSGRVARRSAALGLLFTPGTLVLILGAVAAQARSHESSACGPRSGLAVAEAGACLAPASVCENLTAARLLQDPRVRAAYRHGLETGEPAPAQLEALVSGMRRAVGCEGAAPEPEVAAPGPRLPPGHPPIGPDRRLPPGHPPIDVSPALPPGHPPIGGGPAAPLFQAPETVDI
ncbi:MAG TPA: hypothetical protein VML50_10675 [Anaeromyxobacter sp.]|nr:hypothetical protein [Anaeromyxobacter sp.]